MHALEHTSVRIMGIEGPILNCGSCLCEGGWRRHHLRSRLHGHGHTFTGMRTPSWARARPWSCAYLHGHGLQASPTRPASGLHRSSANPIHSNALRLRNIYTDQAPTQFTQMPCGCVTSPQIYASNRPTQNTWGAWVSTATAASTTTTGAGPLRVIVEPEGSTGSPA